MKQIHFLFIFLLALCCKSCKIDTCKWGLADCVTEYHFTFGFESDPPIREISVGDTFRIRMEIPHLVEDTETGKTYDIADFDYPKKFTSGLMDTTNNTYISAPPGSFEYIAVADTGEIQVVNIGGFTENVFLRLDSFAESKIVAFDLVAKRAGLYLGGIIFYDMDLKEGDNRPRINLTDTCCLERINLVHEYTSVANKNKDLIPSLKQWGDVSGGYKEPGKRIDLDDPRAEKIGIFYFRVVE